MFKIYPMSIRTIGIEGRQIEEENYHLLKTRRLILDTQDGNRYLGNEVAFHELYASLSDEEISKLSKVDFPIFTLTCGPSELRDVVAKEVNYTILTESDRVLYEANILILANRWQRALAKDPNEILFNTKHQINECLGKLTYTQLQTVARRSLMHSRISISFNALNRMVMNTEMSREERNCVLIAG